MAESIDDKARMDWLEKQEGAALVSDDAGHWCVTYDGMQNVPVDPPQDIQTTFFIEKDQWKKSVREAIDAVMLEGIGGD